MQSKSERKEQKRQERIMRRAAKRNERYEAKKAEGLARQKEAKEWEAEEKKRKQEKLSRMEREEQKLDRMYERLGGLSKYPQEQVNVTVRALQSYKKKRSPKSAELTMAKAKEEWDKIPERWRAYLLRLGALEKEENKPYNRTCASFFYDFFS